MVSGVCSLVNSTCPLRQFFAQQGCSVDFRDWLGCFDYSIHALYRHDALRHLPVLALDCLGVICSESCGRFCISCGVAASLGSTSHLRSVLLPISEASTLVHGSLRPMLLYHRHWVSGYRRPWLRLLDTSKLLRDGISCSVIGVDLIKCCRRKDIHKGGFFFQAQR